ncbi:MAG: hypothetical protein ACRD1H_17445, partial [Vicinamibacterales bacterium]
ITFFRALFHLTPFPPFNHLSASTGSVARSMPIEQPVALTPSGAVIILATSARPELAIEGR